MKILSTSGVVLATLALLAAGCSSTPKEEAASEPLVTSPTDAAGAEATSDDAATGPGSTLTVNLDSVFFDFDSFVLTAATRASLQQVAETLRTSAGARVQIEGHCDERGSNEYNLALGEKRARAVEEYLISQGVEASRLSTISYGEERPAAQGSDEESWAKNRRAEFVEL
jgi:peptidoglycan-associated lipoprotein